MFRRQRLVAGGLTAQAIRSAPAKRQPVLLRVSRRLLCAEAEAATRLKNAFWALGLKPGATKKEIKQAYYKVARETHPDAVGGLAARQANDDVASGAANTRVRTAETGFFDRESSDGPPSLPFLQMQAACETLLEALENPEAFASGQQRRRARAGPRAKTLGEVCLGILVSLFSCTWHNTCTAQAEHSAESIRPKRARWPEPLFPLSRAKGAVYSIPLVISVAARGHFAYSTGAIWAQR